MTRKDKYFLAALLLIYTLYRIAVLLKPFPEINGYAIPDDAYLSLDIARNFANGKWFFYGDGTTSGFQPLYVFLMAPVFLIFKNDLNTPVYVSIIIQNIFGYGIIYFMYKLMRNVFEDDYSSFLSVLLFILLPVSIINIGNGLETSISFFFFVLIFYYLYKFQKEEFDKITFRQLFILGVLVGIAMLARIDNIMIISGVILWLIMRGKRTKFIKQVLYFLAGSAVMYLPYMILLYSFTGDFFPVSGKAVHHIGQDMVENYAVGNSNLFELIRLSLQNIYMNYSVVIIFVLVGTLVYRIKSFACPWFSQSLKQHAPLVFTSLLLFFAYTFYLNAYWFYSRYFFPLSLFFAVITAFIINLLIHSFSTQGGKRSVAIVLAVLFIAPNLTRSGFKDFFLAEYKKQGYEKIGEWVNHKFPSGTVIGCVQTGAIGYFSDDKTVINLDGVVNKEAYDAIQKEELMNYIRSKKIEYFIDWDINYEFVMRNSNGFRETDMQIIESADGLKTWGYTWYVYKVKY
ncbi:MAG: glycosyltransferase family 39 protein [Candidatus Kapaibacterium sp.]